MLRLATLTFFLISQFLSFHSGVFKYSIKFITFVASKFTFPISRIDNHKIAVEYEDLITVTTSKNYSWHLCRSKCNSYDSENFQVGFGMSLIINMTEKTAGKYTLRVSTQLIEADFEIFLKDIVHYTAPSSFIPTVNDFVQVQTVGQCESVKFHNEPVFDYGNRWIIYCADEHLLRFSSIATDHYGIYEDGKSTFAFTMIKDLIVLNLGDRLPDTIAVIFPSTTLMVLQDDDDDDDDEFYQTSWKIGDRQVSSNNSHPVYVDRFRNLIVRDWRPENGVISGINYVSNHYFILNIMAIYDTHGIILSNEEMIFGSTQTISCTTTLKNLEFIQLFINDRLVVKSTSNIAQSVSYTHSILEDSAFVTISCHILVSYNNVKRFNKTSVTKTIWRQVVLGEDQVNITIKYGISLKIIWNPIHSFQNIDYWYLNDQMLNPEKNVIYLSTMTRDSVLSSSSSRNNVNKTRLSIMIIPEVTFDNSTYEFVWLPRDAPCSLICRANHPSIKRIYWENTNRPQRNGSNYVEMQLLTLEHRHPTSYVCVVEYLSQGMVQTIRQLIDVTFYTSLENSSTLLIGEVTVIKASEYFPENVSWSTFIEGSLYDAVDRLALSYRNDLFVQMEYYSQNYIMMSPNMFNFNLIGIPSGRSTPLRMSIPPRKSNLQSGDPLELHCNIEIDQNATIEQFYWYSYLSAENPLGIVLPNNDIKLSIPSVSLRDSGKYLCVVEYNYRNSMKSMEKTFDISVEGYEFIDLWKPEYFVKKSVGNTFNFTCGVRVPHSEVPSIRWIHENETLILIQTNTQLPFYVEYYSSILISLDEVKIRTYQCETTFPDSSKYTFERRIVIVDTPIVTIAVDTSDMGTIFACNVQGYYTKMEMSNFSKILASKENKELLMDDVLKYTASSQNSPYNITCNVTQSTFDSTSVYTARQFHVQTLESMISRSNGIIITSVVLSCLALIIGIATLVSRRRP